jgi:hypothetical protein
MKLDMINPILNYAANYIHEAQLHDEVGFFFLLACSCVVLIAIIVNFALSINAFKNTFNQRLKRKFETIQDETPPEDDTRRDVNLVCSNTFYPLFRGWCNYHDTLFVYL